MIFFKHVILALCAHSCHIPSCVQWTRPVLHTCAVWTRHQASHKTPSSSPHPSFILCAGWARHQAKPLDSIKHSARPLHVCRVDKTLRWPQWQGGSHVSWWLNEIVGAETASLQWLYTTGKASESCRMWTQPFLKRTSDGCAGKGEGTAIRAHKYLILLRNGLVCGLVCCLHR